MSMFLRGKGVLRPVCLVAALICASLSRPIAAKKAGTRRGKEVEEGSDACRACKRVVMSLDQVVIPKFKEVFKGKEDSKMYVGSMSVYMQEELSNICTFDLLHYQKQLRKECESLLDEHEDAMLPLLTDHVRDGTRQEAFLKMICVDTARKCPKHVNSTESEQPKQKKEFMTERQLKESDQGPLRRLVAESWSREVLNHDWDVVTLMYTSQDQVTKDTIQALKDAAFALMVCPTVRMGIVNLKMNELPPPHGNYLEGVDGIAMWKGSDPESKDNPSARADKIPVFWTKDWREEGATAFDVLDFVFRSVGRKESFDCISQVSQAQTPEGLQQLQQPTTWREESREDSKLLWGDKEEL